MPWIEDAREYVATDDLESSGIWQTGGIADFLGSVQSPYTVVMAPKGCGKTLLIKFKRKALEGHHYQCLPENVLVDIGAGAAPPLDAKRIELISNNPHYWSSVWQMAFTLAVVKNKTEPDLDTYRPATARLLEDPLLRNPFAIFAEILKFTPSRYREVFDDFQSKLTPLFQTVHTPVAVFVDNVDEFYADHLVGAHNAYISARAQEYWHDAQVGLLMAIRQLTAQNPHVKIFAAIRSEAFNARKSMQNVANLRSHLLSVKFEYGDLRQIFVQNIKAERRANLVDRKARDPIEKFFGVEGAFIRHRFTGKKEDTFKYILRHTLGRPRDLMHIGRRLSDISPANRTPQAVRDCVNTTAVDIAQSYIGEASPHYAWFNQELLFDLLDRNVLTSAQCKEIARAYDDDPRRASDPNASEATGEDALSDLYHAGLLGIVAQPPGGGDELVQKFESLDTCAGRDVNRQKKLPPADTYLVHPVLSAMLQHDAPRFSKRVDSVNVIEPNARWTEDDGMRFVLSGDIVQYSKLVLDSPQKDMFPKIFQNILNRSARSVEHLEVVGDEFVLVDRSGFLLADAAHQIVSGLGQSLFRLQVRLGLYYGFARVLVSDAARMGTDVAIQRSRRLCDASAPGHMLMPTSVREALERYDVEWPFFTVQKDDDTFRARPDQDRVGHW